MSFLVLSFIARNREDSEGPGMGGYGSGLERKGAL